MGMIPPSNSSGNTLIVFASLTGIAFVLVGGIVALAYTDGKNAQIILPVLLGLAGPLITSIIAISKSVENGQKADTAIQQNQQIHALLETVAVQTTTPPVSPVTVNVPPHTEVSGGGTI